jgi:hypothetical protein
VATTLTPSQMAAHVDLSLEPLRHVQGYAELIVVGNQTVPERAVLLHEHRPTSSPKPQRCNTIWNAPIGNRPTTPTFSVSPPEKPHHD